MRRPVKDGGARVMGESLPLFDYIYYVKNDGELWGPERERQREPQRKEGIVPESFYVKLTVNFRKCSLSIGFGCRKGTHPQTSGEDRV